MARYLWLYLPKMHRFVHSEINKQKNHHGDEQINSPHNKNKIYDYTYFKKLGTRRSPLQIGDNPQRFGAFGCVCSVYDYYDAVELSFRIR